MPKSKYLFEYDDVAFDKQKIFLFRNKFCFRDEDYINVENITVKKGSTIKNRWIVLCLGLILITAALVLLYQYFKSIDDFLNPSERMPLRSFGYAMLLPLFIGLFGSIAIYQALAKKLILNIRFTDNKYFIVKIDKINSDKELSDLITFLKTRLNNRVFMKLKNC